MQRREFLSLVSDVIEPLLAHQGFTRLVSEGAFFYRQRGPFLDYVSLGPDRLGIFAHVAACIWVPSLEFERPDCEALDASMLGVKVGGELSPRRIRDSWGWEISERGEAEKSLAGIREAIEQIALPWFGGVNDATSFLRECEETRGYWRKVPREQRETIRADVDAALSDPSQICTYRFAGRGKKSNVKQTRASSVPGYEHVVFEHKNDARPGVKLNVEGILPRRPR